MFLIDALLNVTIYGGLFYIATTAFIFAMNWTGGRIRLEGGQQTLVPTQSAVLAAEQTTTPDKSRIRSTVESGSLINTADTGLVPA